MSKRGRGPAFGPCEGEHTLGKIGGGKGSRLRRPGSDIRNPSVGKIIARMRDERAEEREKRRTERANASSGKGTCRPFLPGVNVRAYAAANCGNMICSKVLEDRDYLAQVPCPEDKCNRCANCIIDYVRGGNEYSSLVAETSSDEVSVAIGTYKSN